MRKNVDYSLYLVTDRDLLRGVDLGTAVRQAISGGVTLVQLREKSASSRDFYSMAISLKEITNSLGVPLIINDRLDIALAVGADGVHVGQDDLPASEVRRIIGPDAIVGVSASSVEEALEAERSGADYLGVGAMFATGTKTDANLASMEDMRAVRGATALPIVAIGGISRENVMDFKGSGIDGIAVVSAILCQDDIKSASSDLRQSMSIVLGKPDKV